MAAGTGPGDVGLATGILLVFCKVPLLDVVLVVIISPSDCRVPDVVVVVIGTIFFNILGVVVAVVVDVVGPPGLAAVLAGVVVAVVVVIAGVVVAAGVADVAGVSVVAVAVMIPVTKVVVSSIAGASTCPALILGPRSLQSCPPSSE